MALTKVRVPVADIEAIQNGTSNVTISTAADDIVVTRGGTTIATFDATGMTFGATLTVVVDNITSEQIDLATTAGAAATIQTNATDLSIETTSAHPVVLGANSTDALTIATDGKVALSVDGTAADHLIDKGYVDTQVALAASLADIVATNTSTGSLSIPNSSGNDIIINWGITASITRGAGATAVTFDTAFPNAFLQGYVSRNIASSGAEAGVNWANGSTTGMDVYQSGSASSPVSWFAIGY